MLTESLLPFHEMSDYVKVVDKYMLKANHLLKTVNEYVGENALTILDIPLAPSWAIESFLKVISNSFLYSYLFFVIIM